MLLPTSEDSAKGLYCAGSALDLLGFSKRIAKNPTRAWEGGKGLVHGQMRDGSTNFAPVFKHEL